jgi:hypothetical protein
MADQPRALPRWDDNPNQVILGDLVTWTEVGEPDNPFTGYVEAVNIPASHALVRLDPPDPDQVQPVEVPLAQLRRVPPGGLRAAASEVLGRTPAPDNPTPYVELVGRLIVAISRSTDTLESVVTAVNELTEATARSRGTLEDGLAKLTEELRSTNRVIRVLATSDDR